MTGRLINCSGEPDWASLRFFIDMTTEIQHKPDAILNWNLRQLYWDVFWLGSLLEARLLSWLFTRLGLVHQVFR